MSVSRYPLAWPQGWPRSKHRRTSAFKVTFDKALRDLGFEIERLGGRYPVLSTNLELRVDGSPRRDRGEPADPGVAVYFELKGKQQVFACDTFRTVGDNVRAIGLTIDAFRAIGRYGASAMLERALSAFEALPAPKCWEILGVRPGASAEEINRAFRAKAVAAHPDSGGSHEVMAALNQARDDALRSAATW